jgi:hypothetical protein
MVLDANSTNLLEPSSVSKSHSDNAIIVTYILDFHINGRAFYLSKTIWRQPYKLIANQKSSCEDFRKKRWKKFYITFYYIFRDLLS